MSAFRVVFCALVLVLLSIDSTAAEEIYRWRDAQGTIHFADAPPAYPAEVSRLDVAAGPPTVRTQQASQTALRRSPDPVTRSINSLINGGPRLRSRRVTTGTLSSKGLGEASSASDQLSQNTVGGRLGGARKADAAARRNGAANDLAVPSLDHALADPVSADENSAGPPAANRRVPSQRSGLLAEAADN